MEPIQLTKEERDGVRLANHPLVQHGLTIMRDEGTGTATFRRNSTVIAQYLAFVATSDLPLTTRLIQTPLEDMRAPTLSCRKLVVASILRAGEGMLMGVLEVIPEARVAHIGLYRREDLEAERYYFKAPSDLGERLVLLIDPMLATGNSAVSAINQLKDQGAKHIRFLCIVSAPEGIRQLRSKHPDVDIYTAALDERLNDHGYIVPGLGDAGDRIFGTK